jgi:hypothetical protein
MSVVCDNDFNLFFCPKPAVDTANGCALNDYICLFARGTQIPYCMTDYITGHELGHVVQFNFCKTYSVSFNKYMELRLPNSSFNERDKIRHNMSNLPWDEQPSEWFAEDFRYLFGVDKDKEFWGLPIPKPNEQIKEFLLSL